MPHVPGFELESKDPEMTKTLTLHWNCAHLRQRKLYTEIIIINMITMRIRPQSFMYIRITWASAWYVIHGPASRDYDSFIVGGALRTLFLVFCRWWTPVCETTDVRLYGRLYGSTKDYSNQPRTGLVWKVVFKLVKGQVGVTRQEGPDGGLDSQKGENYKNNLK